MIVRSDTPKLLAGPLKAIFFETYDATPIQFERVATVVPSTGADETYAWLGQVPTVREWTDERLPQGLSEFSYTIVNKDWENSIAVDRNELEDDRYGQVRLRCQQLAEEARRYQDQLVFEFLASGFTALCYDGKAFFATTHKEGDSGTQSNKGTSALSAPALQGAISQMMKFKNDRGVPVGIVPDTLVVPPDLKWTAMELLNSAYYPEQTTQANPQKMAANVLQGSLELIVSPYLTDTNDWYLLCTRRIVKPILFQLRRAVQFSALEGESEAGFMRKEWFYGSDARYNVGFSDWRFAYGSQVT